MSNVTGLKWKAKWKRQVMETFHSFSTKWISFLICYQNPSRYDINWNPSYRDESEGKSKVLSQYNLKVLICPLYIREKDESKRERNQTIPFKIVRILLSHWAIWSCMSRSWKHCIYIQTFNVHRKKLSQGWCEICKHKI